MLLVFNTPKNNIMDITRKEAIALFVASGKKEAQVVKLTKTILTKRLTKLVGEDAPEGLDKDQAKQFKKLASADEINILADAKEEKAPAKKGDKAPAEKKKKAKAAPKPKKGLPGIRNVEVTGNRPYSCGTVFAAHGLEGGLTPEMVEEIDKACGVPNERESLFAARNAWQAIRGYCEAKGEKFNFAIAAEVASEEE